MSYFKTKMHQIRFRLGSTSDPMLGELTALPQTRYLDLKGFLREGGGRTGQEEREGFFLYI